MQKIEDVKKFMLAVEQITTLVEYGIVFEEWFNDVSMQVRETSPAAILAKTASIGGVHRTDTLKFLVGSKVFRGNVFTNEEKDCFRDALRLAAAGSM